MKNSNIDPALKKFFWISLIGLIIAILWVFIRNQVSGPLAYPYDTFFFRPDDRWNDFFNDTKIPNFPEHFWALPPAALTVALLQKCFLLIFGRNEGFAGFSLFWVSALAFSLIGYFRSSAMHWSYRLRMAFIMMAVCFPVLFCFDRGHFAGLVISLIAFAYVDFEYGKGRWAPLLIAAAAAIKLVPLALILLFIARRDWRKALLTIVILFILTIVCAFIIRSTVAPEYNIDVWQKGLKLYLDKTATGAQSYDFDTSFWGGIRSWLLWAGWLREDFSRSFLPVYNVLMLVIAGLLTAGAWMKRWTTTEAFVLASIYTVGGGTVMMTYYMIIVLPVAFALSNAGPGIKQYRWLIYGAALLAIPKPYFVGEEAIRISRLIDPLLLMIGFCLLFFKTPDPQNQNH